MVKASESVHKHQEKVKCAVKAHRSASNAVATKKSAFRAASPGSRRRDALRRSLEQAKKIAGKAATKAAIANANLRTAKAKARAVEFAESEKLRKREEKVKRKEDLDKAINAFVKKWNKKRDREESAKETKRAKKYAAKLGALAGSSGDKDKKIAVAVAENAKAAARRATKARKTQA